MWLKYPFPPGTHPKACGPYKEEPIFSTTDIVLHKPGSYDSTHPPQNAIDNDTSTDYRNTDCSAVGFMAKSSLVQTYLENKMLLKLTKICITTVSSLPESGIGPNLIQIFVKDGELDWTSSSWQEITDAIAFTPFTSSGEKKCELIANAWIG